MTMNDLLVIEKDFDLREIIDGEEYILNSPFRKHQRISQNLDYIIFSHIKKNNLGYLYTSPLDVILDDAKGKEVTLQPDLIFISKENAGIEQDWIRGIPNMLCEIVSKYSHYRDTIKKRKIYERYKIPEYWLVYPEYSTIEIYIIEQDGYELYSMATDNGVVKSKVVEGLEFEIEDIFK